MSPDVLDKHRLDNTHRNPYWTVNLGESKGHISPDVLDKHRLDNTYRNSHWTGYPGEHTTYNIAGSSYRSKEVQDAFKSKSSGTIILLKRERDNPHDPNAVAIYAALSLKPNKSYEWHKIGYIEQTANKEFKDLPDGVILEGTKYGSYTIQLSGKVRRYK